MPATHATSAARPRPTSVSPILAGALLEAEQLGSRYWHPGTPEQAEALAELRVAMAVDACVPLVHASQVLERIVTHDWSDGTADQAACQRRLHDAVHRRR